MLYLLKAQRDFGNHQYIIGVCKDLDIAHFQAHHHCKHERADKYNYSIEEIPYAEGECFIASWEVDDEILAYRIWAEWEEDSFEEFKEKHTPTKEQEEEYFEHRIKAYYKYRFRAQKYEPLDYEISHEDFAHVASVWWFEGGRVLAGLHKVYTYFRENDEDERFWKVFYDRQKGG